MTAQGNKTITIDGFVSVHRNTLRGFAKITLPSGLILADVGIHLDGNRAWASPASKPMLDRDGSAVRDASGKVRYVPIVSFKDKPTRDRFSDAVVAALKAKFPGALS